MSAGLDAAEVRVRARLVARERREDERRRRPTRSRRPISSPTSASTGSATTSSPTSASAPTATSPTRRWSQRYNADLANNFGNLANRVLEHGRELLRRCRARDARERPARRRRVGHAYDDARGDRHGSTSRAAFGAVWDLIRATNAFIEDRAPWALNKAGDTDAVAGVIGDCLEALRIVALLASPVIPNAAGRALAPARPARAGPRTSAPGRGGVGAAARGIEAGEGRPAVPAQGRRVTADRRDTWVDAHCHLQLELGEARFDADDADAQVQRGTRRGRRVDGVRRHRPRDVARRRVDLAARYDDVYATVGLHPHDASQLDAEWDGLVALADAERVRRDRRGRASTSTTSTRRATSRRSRSGARSGSPTRSTAR